MKILLYTDVHFSESSSIVNTAGKEYSLRLEKSIESLNWAENLAIEQNCDEIICLGDFFNSSDLNSNEITAVTEIKWAKLPHTFVIGNHDASKKALKFNSVNMLSGFGFTLVDKITCKAVNGVDLVFIPYLNEEDRKPLNEYLVDNGHKKIIFSHNTISGIEYGSFMSTEGFKIDEIEQYCDLFLNGHLHNGSKFCKNGYNLGNLTGQNFTEDASKYSHNAFVLDTETLELTAFENPHAFNFYSITINDNKDIKKLLSVKNNAVVIIKVKEELKEAVQQAIVSIVDKFAVTPRISVIRTTTGEVVEINKLADTNYIKQFAQFVKDNPMDANPEVIQYELEQILK